MKEIDPTHHELVPEHIVLTDEEVEELLETYEITKDKLPLMRAGDPVARAIDAKPGQVVKIIRRGSPAGTAVTYRLIIK
ncbi:MAG: DNA-directed RNA polymerase subunit H [Candidatus Methanofastidiosia archaeon]|jgi:DNA-directed RNA polymerase subunit H